MKDENPANFLYDSIIKYYFHDVLYHIVMILEIKLEGQHENMQHHIQIM